MVILRPKTCEGLCSDDAAANAEVILHAEPD